MTLERRVKAVSTFYGRITDAMRIDSLARLHGGIASRGLSASQINDMTTFINLPGGSANICLWSVGAKTVSTFYGRITDTMRTDPLARLHGGIASRALPASQINDMTTLINLPGASAKKWLWSVGAKAVSTFYERILSSVRMNPLARLHGGIASRGLPASQINDMTTFINLPGASAKI
ncbi:hypothetical protein GN958_ATG11714 [Phytophthora infestans]|uniref:Uncharacterized protein n=1 Tax=Phytophthora infestans TaxID=4787 RepID=A0A8S9UDM4_PHYIN|nr:hypothetical protein GN958_ATG13229 [Phytophthora infestans]KAF4139096.1 hypothetical protein GN958_ATG11714 [Phytophthora infestans]